MYIPSPLPVPFLFAFSPPSPSTSHPPSVSSRDVRVARYDLSQKESQVHLLRETETTMKFGLFSMVLGYLHAMRLVQREKEAWSGRGDAIGADVDARFKAPLTQERKRMLQVCGSFIRDGCSCPRSLSPTPLRRLPGSRGCAYC